MRPFSLGDRTARELYVEDAGRSIYDALKAGLAEPLPVPSAGFLAGFYGTRWDAPDYTELDTHAKRIFGTRNPHVEAAESRWTPRDPAPGSADSGEAEPELPGVDRRSTGFVQDVLGS